MKQLDFSVIKDLRKAKGLNQAQMSSLLYMEQPTYSKIESGSRKNVPIVTFQRIAAILEIPLFELIARMMGKASWEFDGIEPEEVETLMRVLKDKPLRSDEFVFLSLPVINLHKYNFNNNYPESGMWMKGQGDDMTNFYETLEDPVNVIISDSMEIEQVFENEIKTGIVLWLANQPLGDIDQEHSSLVSELLDQSRISRIVMINNEYSVPGLYDTYMKAIVIVTNAQGREVKYEHGRFLSLRVLNPLEIEELENGIQQENEEIEDELI